MVPFEAFWSNPPTSKKRLYKELASWTPQEEKMEENAAASFIDTNGTL